MKTPRKSPQKFHEFGNLRSLSLCCRALRWQCQGAGRGPLSSRLGVPQPPHRRERACAWHTRAPVRPRLWDPQRGAVLRGAGRRGAGRAGWVRRWAAGRTGRLTGTRTRADDCRSLLRTRAMCSAWPWGGARSRCLRRAATTARSWPASCVRVCGLAACRAPCVCVRARASSPSRTRAAPHCVARAGRCDRAACGEGTSAP